MARVDSSRIAVWKAGEAKLDLKGSVVASEALFPFADGLIAAADAGRHLRDPAGRLRPRRRGHRRPPTRAAWRWCSPGSGISNTRAPLR
jgi:hypothetical protein